MGESGSTMYKATAHLQEQRDAQAQAQAPPELQAPNHAKMGAQAPTHRGTTTGADLDNETDDAGQVAGEDDSSEAELPEAFEQEEDGEEGNNGGTGARGEDVSGRHSAASNDRSGARPRPVLKRKFDKGAS